MHNACNTDLADHTTHRTKPVLILYDFLVLFCSMSYIVIHSKSTGAPEKKLRTV